MSKYQRNLELYGPDFNKIKYRRSLELYPDLNRKIYKYKVENWPNYFKVFYKHRMERHPNYAKEQWQKYKDRPYWNSENRKKRYRLGKLRKKIFNTLKGVKIHGKKKKIRGVE
jgi:hypothetical protein